MGPPVLATASFVNPLAASSQRVRLTNIPQDDSGDATFRCKITDALGNFDYTPAATFGHYHQVGGPIP